MAAAVRCPCHHLHPQSLCLIALQATPPELLVWVMVQTSCGQKSQRPLQIANTHHSYPLQKRPRRRTAAALRGGSSTVASSSGPNHGVLLPDLTARAAA